MEIPVSRPGDRLLVFIAGEECPHVRVAVIERSIGGRLVDYALLDVALDSHQPPQVGPLSALVGQGLVKNVNVFDLLSAGSQTPLLVNIQREADGRILHWGVVSGAQLALGGQESLRLISRLEDYLLGPKRLSGIETPRMGQFSEDAVQIIDEPIVFNPMFDGRVRPNMGFDSLSGNPYKAFIDPDSVTTAAAQANNNLGEPGAYWTVADMLLYLCWRANPNETYVKNPSREELVAALALPPAEKQQKATSLADETELVRNLGVRDGATLSEALDQVCGPLSIFWWVEPESLDVRRLRFLLPSGNAQSESAERMPPPETSWNLEAGRVLEVELEASIAELANSVEVVCDYLYVEAAFPLLTTWEDGDVPDDLEDLVEGSDAWNADPSLRRMFRFFTADYLTLERDELDTAILPELRETVLEFFKFGEHFVGDEKVSNNLPNEKLDWKIPRRGRFYPTITQGPNGDPIGTDPGGVLVEYSAEEDAQGNPIWLPLRELLIGSGCEIQLLEDQFGIYIAGTNPPWGLVDLFGREPGPNDPKPQLRIVATIRSDVRPRVLNRAESYDGAEPSKPDAPDNTRQPLPVHHIEDASRRFQYRAVHKESPFFDKLEAGDLSADTINDIFPTEFEQSPAQRYAAQLLKFVDCGKLRGHALLDGLDGFAGTLGDACPNLLEHRQIGLTGAVAANLPRVIGVQFDVARQQTRLVIETHPAVPYLSPYPDPAPEENWRNRLPPGAVFL